MKTVNKVLALATIVVALLSTVGECNAQGPRGKEFGFGIIIGEPLGLTAKYWVNKENALVFDIGASYFGAPRFQVDYLWHLNVFQSQIVKLYAGPGLGLGFGTEGSGFWYKDKYHRGYWIYREEGLGVAMRVMVGVNIIPRNTPIEIFFELGPNMGVIPNFGVGLDAAVGIRFYP
jgi:hypothetical protein